MNPAVMSTTLLLLIGAVNGVSLSPGDYDVDGISVQFGSLCDASADEWYLNGQKSSVFDDWAIELELTDDFAVSSGDRISFEIDGSKKLNDPDQWNEGDMFMAFGDGEKYIAFGLDFDGGLGNWAGKNSPDNIKGMLIYPPCSGGDMAKGSVSDLLDGVSSHLNPWGSYDARYAVRDLLAGGHRAQWGLFSGESIFNENTWPVTIEIVTGDDEVTFRFSSESVSAECTYSDTFADGDFVFGMLGEPEDGDQDNFYIESIDVAVSTPIVLLDEAGPVDVEAEKRIGAVDILNDMHFELDFVVNSWPTDNGWGNIFSCGEESLERYPLVMIHEDSGNDGEFAEGLYVQFRDGDDATPTSPTFLGDALELNVQYHLEIELSQSRFVVVLDGESVYDREKEPHSQRESMPCWASSKWFSAGDVTISNVLVTSTWPMLSVPPVVVLDEAGPLDVERGERIGAVDIVDDMQFEMDIVINSWPTGWGNIFSCGEEKTDRYPLVMIHKLSGDVGAYQEGFFVQFRDGADGTPTNPTFMGDALELNVPYHLEIELTQSRFLVLLDGKPIFDGAKEPHSQHDQVPCWASSDGFPAGDVTISNVLITSTSDPSLNAAAHSMSVEGDSGAEHDSVQKPMDDMNPIALTLIGAVVVVVIALLFVVMRGRTKREQTAKETVAEMSEVVEAPAVVHVADDTAEVSTESAVAEASIPETTANGMEEAVEVKVNTETV